MNSEGTTELPPVFPGQGPSCLGLKCGERPLAGIDSAIAHLGLSAAGDPEDDEEEEEEEEKKGEEDEEDEEDEENDGEEKEVPWQVA